MQIGSFGDLAKSYSMQTRNTALKQDIQRLTTELSSGQVADIRSAVTGKTAYINDIARNLETLDAYDLATTEARQFAVGTQAALERINDLGNSFSSTLIAVANTGYNSATSGLDQEAYQTLQGVIGALNTNVGGRSLFAGTSTNTLPLVDVNTLLDDVRAVISGSGSVDDMIAAAKAWFDSATGFEADAYMGTTQSIAPTSISRTEQVSFTTRADDPALRDMMQSLALVALVDDPTLALTPAQKSELFSKSIEPTLSASGKVIELQRSVGFGEEQIEQVQSRNSAERSALEMARSSILGVDPYEAATELEQVQFQLQSLYAITSRMSQLSLVNFL